MAQNNSPKIRSAMFTEDGNIGSNGNMFLGTEGDSELKYSMILIWLLCMWIQLKNILPSNDLIDIEKDHIEA